jgi:HPt (histidine-containing phosphotransfer) domain-containing protein
VLIDPLLQDLIPGFIDKRRQDLPKFAEALAAADYETVRKLGHNLKGTGASYGFDLLSEFGAQIEEAAKLQDRATIHAKVEELTRYLTSIKWSASSSPAEE